MIREAQATMRQNYRSGGPGVALSAAIGLRYLVFTRIYGLKWFLMLGGLLIGLGRLGSALTGPSSWSPWRRAL